MFKVVGIFLGLSNVSCLNLEENLSPTGMWVHGSHVLDHFHGDATEYLFLPGLHDCHDKGLLEPQSRLGERFMVLRTSVSRQLKSLASVCWIQLLPTVLPCESPDSPEIGRKSRRLGTALDLPHGGFHRLFLSASGVPTRRAVPQRWLCAWLRRMKRNESSHFKRVSKQTLTEFSIMRQENEAGK